VESNAYHHLVLFRPNDSRTVVALGECYQKLNRVDEAKKV
jgi:Flp pilus assembly protein TadD